MANNAYLINTVIFSSSIDEIMEKDDKYKILATGSNRIPVPWFFGFDKDDLKPAEYNYHDYYGEKVSFKYQAPCASKEKVLSNIVARKELFIEFCGDKALGEEYWEKAVSDLQNLEHPFIFLHPLEVLFLNNPEEEAIEFNKSFTATSHSFASIELLSFYQKGHLPYGLVEFYANPYLSDDNKRKNAAALDMGINGVDISSWVKPTATDTQPEQADSSKSNEEPKKEQNKKPWWKIW